jgi:hypothetical protein
VKGPFIAKLPKGLEAMKDLPALGFTSPKETLAEKFHMSEALLTALNPRRNWASEKGIGMHGTAEPSRVGKTESHGCVRLTNRDVGRLAALVKKGIPVDFVEPVQAERAGRALGWPSAELGSLLNEIGGPLKKAWSLRN